MKNTDEKHKYSWDTMEHAIDVCQSTTNSWLQRNKYWSWPFLPVMNIDNREV